MIVTSNLWLTKQLVSLLGAEGNDRLSHSGGLFYIVSGQKVTCMGQVIENLEI